jgi:hypothetical protein
MWTEAWLVETSFTGKAVASVNGMNAILQIKSENQRASAY